MSKKDIQALQQICIFIVKVYVKYWFVAEIPEKAPKNYLNFIKDCQAFESVNPKITRVVKKKLFNHLWYLSPQNASLSFFDDDVSLVEKKGMVLKLKDDKLNDDEEGETKKISVHPSQTFVHENGIEQFISPESLKFVKKFNFGTEWINDDPESWKTNQNYLRCKDVVKSLKVVNDIAERNVQLFANYNGHLTKNEDQIQYIMQIHEAYRQKFSSLNKQDLMGDF